ncbi:unnamed protein product, partial [Mesorhabditis belari]|uniref:Uncharacterized protein n=1 Tax=Mesorhabditis belari TaxID=2138241 RepID=A0AAF3EM56_9BILA
MGETPYSIGKKIKFDKQWETKKMGCWMKETAKQMIERANKELQDEQMYTKKQYPALEETLAVTIHGLNVSFKECTYVGDER